MQHNEFNEDIRGLCVKTEGIHKEESKLGKRKLIKKKEKGEPIGEAIKGSPKTTVDNYPKRKMSMSEQEGSTLKMLMEG